MERGPCDSGRPWPRWVTLPTGGRDGASWLWPQAARPARRALKTTSGSRPGQTFGRGAALAQCVTAREPAPNRRHGGAWGRGWEPASPLDPARDGLAAAAANRDPPLGGAVVAAHPDAGRRGWVLTPGMGAPFSLPAGHRPSLREQRQRVEPPGTGLAAAGGEAAGRTRALTAAATAAGSGCSRNGGRVLAPPPPAGAPEAAWGQRQVRRTPNSLPLPRELPGTCATAGT